MGQVLGKIVKISQEDYQSLILNGSLGDHVYNDNNLYLVNEIVINRISNPNLIMNPDFKINQRGYSSYTATNEHNTITTVDRWFLRFSGHKITTENNYITLKANSILSQVFEDTSNWWGKTMTLSMETDNGIITKTAKMPNAAPTEGKVLFSSDTINGALIRLYYWYYQDGSSLERIVLEIIAGANDVDIYWAKLEFSPFATLFIPPNKAIELHRCQRYYVSITPYTSSLTDYNNMYITAGCLTSSRTTYLMPIFLPNNLRTLPYLADQHNVNSYYSKWKGVKAGGGLCTGSGSDSQFANLYLSNGYSGIYGDNGTLNTVQGTSHFIVINTQFSSAQDTSNNTLTAYKISDLAFSADMSNWS